MALMICNIMLDNDEYNETSHALIDTKHPLNEEIFTIEFLIID